MKLMAFKALVTVAFCLFCQSTIASPWVGTQDKQLHYDLQTLVEWGYLDLSVTTFPVPWKGVAEELERIKLDSDAMPFMPRQALARLQYYLRIQKQMKSRNFLTLQGASDDVRFRGLDDGVEETGEISLTREMYFDRWSVQLSVNHASGGRTNYDNSFVAYQFGDWNVRLGSLDQFWGPAQSSSLILSNNTRPVKSLALSRSSSGRSESPWLSWAGPWYFTTQLGEMDQNRVVPKTKLLMNRITARPLKGLEVGLSWVAMWGGEGQQEDLSTFIEVITFDNVCARTDGECTDAQLTKRGNHIAGIDINYTANLLGRPVSFYLQRIGEDAVNGIRVTDNANLFGISTYLHQAKVFLETSDTNVNCDGGATNRFDCYYENGTYQTGYRMYGRTLGSTFDSDAKQITLGANYRFNDGAVAELYVRGVELNKDGSLPSPVLTDFPSEDVLEFSGFYQRPWGDWQLRVGGIVADREFESDSETDAHVYVKAQYQF